jgi:putrescine transport system substrate-binding protein
MEAYDPGNRYAVNYMWGTTGLGYDAGKVAELAPGAPVDSWALLFDPVNAARLAQCGIYVLDTPDDVIPAALSYLGLDPRTDDPDAIAKAGEAIERIRPYVRKFDTTTMINALADGDICLALAYSGDVLQARYRAEENGSGARLAYAAPKEGAAISFDSFVIPKDAPHPEEAHIFLDYMMRPDVAARNSNYVYYANGNRGSHPLLDEAVIGDPSIYPDAETMARLFPLPPREARLQRSINRMWAALKSGA